MSAGSVASVVSHKIYFTGRSEFASSARQRQGDCAGVTTPWARTLLEPQHALFLRNEAALRGSRH